VAAACFISCSEDARFETHLGDSKTKLIYYGLIDQSETREDSVRLSSTWGRLCSHWRPTVSEKDADYRVLFGSPETVTLIGRRGEVLYTGGQGVLYLPHGNPDGTGVNLCKLTGE